MQRTYLPQCSPLITMSRPLSRVGFGGLTSTHLGSMKHETWCQDWRRATLLELWTITTHTCFLRCSPPTMATQTILPTRQGSRSGCSKGDRMGDRGGRVTLYVDELGIGVQLPKMSHSGVLDNGFQAGVIKPRSAIGVCPPVVIVIILATKDGDGLSIACSK
jgi:hypothetical protein